MKLRSFKTFVDANNRDVLETIISFLSSPEHIYRLKLIKKYEKEIKTLTEPEQLKELSELIIALKLDRISWMYLTDLKYYFPLTNMIDSELNEYVHFSQLNDYLTWGIRAGFIKYDIFGDSLSVTETGHELIVN